MINKNASLIIVALVWCKISFACNYQIFSDTQLLKIIGLDSLSCLSEKKTNLIPVKIDNKSLSVIDTLDFYNLYSRIGVDSLKKDIPIKSLCNDSISNTGIVSFSEYIIFGKEKKFLMLSFEVYYEPLRAFSKTVILVHNKRGWEIIYTQNNWVS